MDSNETGNSLVKKGYPQLPPKHGDLALGLLLAESPLNGVQTIVCGQGDVPSANCRTDRTCQDVGLRVETDAHSVGVHHSQGPIIAQLIAVPHLVCRGTQADMASEARGLADCD